MYFGMGLLMEFFFPFQHIYELVDPSGSSLGFLRRLYSKQNRISICAIERGKKGFGLRTLV
jgi:hypothetical protein